MSAHTVEILLFSGDLSLTSERARLAIETATFDVGLVVASAGFGSAGKFLDQDITTELNMLEVNCAAVLDLAHVYGNRLKKRGKGGFIFLSSILAFQGVANTANYAATKAWVQAFAEGRALEWRPQGIDVLTGAPAPVLAAFGSRAKMNITSGLTARQVARPLINALGKRTTVLPGWLSKLLVGSLKTCPRPLRTFILSGIIRKMTLQP